ncbi:MAG: dTDP-glucose 4,6-dehydratase [Chitinispirillaceae bacterium]|nr:dTDP-glucose 4,6-dehydratase [Chitinispirillaceae bacterium]
MKKILVTGGAGFIGSNFVHYILERRKEYHVVNLDALTYAGNLDNLKQASGHPQYQFVKGDINDTGLLVSLFREHRFDAVVHFAAESHVDRSITAPDQFVITNVLGTHALLKTARAAWEDRFSETRFIHVSTDEVYGTLGPRGSFSETTPLSPNSPYSASKAGSDLLVRSYHETWRFPAIITRCSNNYGPYQFPEKLIPLMITNALAGTPLPVYGDGMNVRDWLYVQDHCSALCAVLERGVCGEVYNIGGCNEQHNIDIVKLILTHLRKPESLISFVTDRPGHDRRYAIDATKIKTGLGWSPSVTFEQGLTKTIDWYLQNQWWWSPLLQK